MKLSSIKLTVFTLISLLLVAVIFYLSGVQDLTLALLLLPVVVVGVFSYLWNKAHCAQLGKVQTELIEAHSMISSIRQSVNQDALTGLYSRAYVRERLEERLLIAKKRNTKCAVLYIDLDFFKEFNDALGHNLGNQLLVSVANRLKTLVKKGDLLGYQGGMSLLLCFKTSPIRWLLS